MHCSADPHVAHGSSGDQSQAHATGGESGAAITAAAGGGGGNRSPTTMMSNVDVLIRLVTFGLELLLFTPSPLEIGNWHGVGGCDSS